MESNVLKLVQSIPRNNVLRIDIGMEGDWSSTVVTVWTRENGILGFDKVVRSHLTNKPSLELYYDGVWLGIHCFQREKEVNYFDEELAREIVQCVELIL